MTKKTSTRTTTRKASASGAAKTPPAEAPKRQEVSVSAAKGRPMLTWVGKRPLKRVTAFPAQLVETFNPLNQKGGWQNLLFHGDNKEVLAWLLANGFRGKVNLIYIDPPFDSGADYVRKVQLRGAAGVTKIDGETYTLGEQIQYTDIWANDNYLQFMYERLLLLRELSCRDGQHLCPLRTRAGVIILRVLLDEVFGGENFRNRNRPGSGPRRMADAKTIRDNSRQHYVLRKGSHLESIWHDLRIKRRRQTQNIHIQNTVTRRRYHAGRHDSSGTSREP